MALQLGHSFSETHTLVSYMWLQVEEQAEVLFLLTLLFLPGLVTDGWAELQPGSIRQSAAPGTHDHAETRLLQDLTVVVVSVSHCPAGKMPLSVLVFG